MGIDTCATVKVATDNADGFYICDADKIPKGAKLFEKKDVVPSFDYAIREKDGEGFKGRAKKVCDELSQAETYMLEKDLDLDVWGIEERARK